MQQNSDSYCRYGYSGETEKGLESELVALPAGLIGVQDLNLGSQQLLKQLVDKLYEQYGSRVSERFTQLRGKISQRQLYVMFEPTLNCNPLSDHQKPKDVLPLFQPYLYDAETQLLSLFDADLPKTIFDYYLAILTAQITSYSQLQLKLDYTQEELSRFYTQTMVQADIIKTLQQTILQEKQKHTRETALLRDYLLAKARYAQQYQPDFTDIYRYQEVLAMPDISADLEYFRQKTAKQIRLDNRPLIQENKELKEMHAQLTNKVKQSEQARRLIADECDAATAALDRAEEEIKTQKQALNEMSFKTKTLEEDAAYLRQEIAELLQEREKHISEFKNLAIMNRQLHAKIDAVALDDSKQRLSAAFEKIDRYEAEILEQKKALSYQQLRIYLLETSSYKNGLTKFEEYSREQQRIIDEMRQVNSKLFEEVRNLRYRKNRSGEFSSLYSRDDEYSALRYPNKAVYTEFELVEKSTSSLACFVGIASRNDHYNYQEAKGQTKTGPAPADYNEGYLVQHYLNVSFGSRKGGRQANIRLVNGANHDDEFSVDLNVEDASASGQRTWQPADSQSKKRVYKFRKEREEPATGLSTAAKQGFRDTKSRPDGPATQERMSHAGIYQDEQGSHALSDKYGGSNLRETSERHFAGSNENLSGTAPVKSRKPAEMHYESQIRECAADYAVKQELTSAYPKTGQLQFYQASLSSNLFGNYLERYQSQECAKGSGLAYNRYGGVVLSKRSGSSYDETKSFSQACELRISSDTLQKGEPSRRSASSPVINEPLAKSPEGTGFSSVRDAYVEIISSRLLGQDKPEARQDATSSYLRQIQVENTGLSKEYPDAEHSAPEEAVADQFLAVAFAEIDRNNPVIAQLAAQMGEKDVLEVIVNPQEIVLAENKHRSLSIKLQMEAAAHMYNEEDIHTICEEDGGPPDGIFAKNTKPVSDELRAQEEELTRIRAYVSENNSLCADTTQSAIFAFSQLFDPRGQDLSSATKKQLINEIDRQKTAAYALAQRISESADEFAGTAELDRLLVSELEIYKMRGQLINYLLANDTLLDYHLLDPCYRDEMLALAGNYPYLTRYFIEYLVHGFFSPFQVRKLLLAFHQHDSSVQALVYDLYDSDLLLALLNNKLTVRYADSLLGALTSAAVQYVLCKDQYRAETFVAAQKISGFRQECSAQASPNIFYLSQNIKECLQIYHHWGKQAIYKADIVLSEDFLNRLESGEDIGALVGDLKTMLDSSLGCLLSANMGSIYAANLRKIYYHLEELKAQPTRCLLEEILSEITELPVGSILSKGLSETARKTVSSGVRQMKSHLGANALLDEHVAEEMARGDVSRRNVLNICNVLYDERSMSRLAFPANEPARSKEALEGLVNVLYNPELPQNVARRDGVKHLARAFYSPEIISGLFGYRKEAYEKGMRCCNVVNATLNGAAGNAYKQCAPFQFAVLRGKSIVGGETSGASVLALKDRPPQGKVQHDPAIYRVRLNARSDFEQAFCANSGPGNAKTGEHTKNLSLRKNALRSKYLVQVPQHYTVDITGLLRVEAQGQRIAQTGKQATAKAPVVLPRQARHERENRQQGKLQKPYDAEIVLRLLGNGYVSDSGFEK